MDQSPLKVDYPPNISNKIENIIMDDKLKQQINSWTKANEDRKVIDLLEGISPAERGFEETGL